MAMSVVIFGGRFILRRVPVDYATSFCTNSSTGSTTTIYFSVIILLIGFGRARGLLIAVCCCTCHLRPQVAGHRYLIYGLRVIMGLYRGKI
jgi:hypothetical protein